MEQELLEKNNYNFNKLADLKQDTINRQRRSNWVNHIVDNIINK